MKRFLLASAAAISLAVAAPAFAQTTQPPPATPPVVQPTPDPDVTTEENAPEAAPQAEPSTTAEPPTVAAQPSVTGEAQTPQTETAPAQAAQAAPPAQPATTEAPTNAPEATQTAAAETPAAAAQEAAAGGETPAFASANAVCQPRTTSVHFGRSNALSRQNQNAIEYALDSASVCDIQQITIADSSANQRRANAVRATLVRQGVPEERITIAQQASADLEAASTGRLDVQMQFAGVTNQAELEPTATSGRNAAANSTMVMAEATPQAAPVPRATPAPAAPACSSSDA